MTRMNEQSCGSEDGRRNRVGGQSLHAGRWTAWILALGVLLVSFATGQSTSQLNGNVTDPSGASVAGAKIVLTESTTGFKRTTTSNSSGLYQFLDVPPGNYKLRADAKGFAPFLAENVTLVVKVPSTIPIRFQVAGTQESVTVQGEAPLINRTDATLGNVLESNQISELPIANRNVVELLSLQPGVAFLGDQLDQDTDTRSGAVNGLRSDQSNVQLDGIGVNDQNNGYAFTSVLYVPPDSVEEFRVTTANSNADSGYSSGAQVSLVTKSGTNSFHGSVYEYNRNTIFSANDPFLKESQLSSGETNTAPKLQVNWFGAAVGGPIKKNRLFFFANYEGRRIAQGTSVLRTVPSATLRAGDLVYLCQRNSDGSLDTVDCPGGTVNGVAGVQPGYYALGPAQIQQMDPDTIGISQGVMGVLSQYPNPNENASGDGVNTLGFRFASNADSTYNTYISRLDYHITSTGSESLFFRGQTQNFKEPQTQQFPGQPTSTTILDDSKGVTVGLTSLLNPRQINDFHWGYVRQGYKDAGISQYPGIYLNGLTDLTPFTRSITRFVPVNQFSDNLNWTRGNHTLQFGGDIFLIRNSSISTQNSFSDIQTNPVYLDTGGIAYPGSPSPLNPPNNINPATGNPYPTVDENFGPNYDGAIAVAMGIFAEGDGIYNYARNGTALAQGTPINRRYAINDYEVFGQDTWHMTPRLTLTYGLRWILDAPPYETNGYQVAPCVEATGGGCTNQTVADWFNNTAHLMSQGQPANNAGEISFVLGGPVNHGPGLWNWDRKDFSPRIAVAWAPDTGDGRLAQILGHKDQFTVRAGYSIVYDHFGIPVVNSFDQHGSFGLSTDLGNPAGSVTVANTFRFTCLIPGSSGQSCLPTPCPSLQDAGCLFGPAPSGGFPVTPANTAFAINWGLDQSVKTPYTHMFNFSLQRQITARSSLQLAYVGSVARRLPMQVDLAMPANPTDPASGITYFQAAKMLSQQAAAGAAVNSIQPIPFWENFFPGWAGMPEGNLTSQSLACAPGTYPANPTATQAIYELWSCYLHNETLALSKLDLPASLASISTPLPNSKFGPYTFFHDQFSSLYAWRNIGTSDYNALQVTYNVRWGNNLQGQFNYTFSKSLDEESQAQRIGPYEGTGGTGSDLNGGGIVINAWQPLSLRGLSDFNAFHQLNANLVYMLPFGKGQMLASNAGSVMNELIGGWNVSGIFRWTSGFPITVDNGPDWPTDWNIEGDAEPNGPLPKATNPKNAIVNGQGIGPDIFQNPAAAEAAFRPDWPGESGVRNNVIGEGMFDIDTGVSKNFSLGEQRRLEFSWQAFNTTNSVRYDVRAAQPDIAYDPTQFGKYISTLTTPRFMQFSLRLVF